MKSLYVFLVFIAWISSIHSMEFTQESPYMLVRLMDLKVHEWKPGMLDEFEKVLDAELKYSDEKKGIACKSIDFEQAAGYPKQDARFLDLSIRGLCTDESGKVHDIDKGLMTDAIKRHAETVNRVTSATLYKVGNVVFFNRDRNKLNLIIIPICVGFVVILIVVTFVLRRLRNAQKRRHILAQLQKKRESSGKKAPTVPNTDPHASETQRLLQLDPTVVGSASDTLGSPKEFTNEHTTNPLRNKGSSPTKTNQAKSQSRERMNIQHDNEPRFPTDASDYRYDREHSDMIPMHEQQPRVVVRTVRDDGGHPPSSSFTPIPVQIERSGLQQRNTAAPYHSDPYYRNVNT